MYASRAIRDIRSGSSTRSSSRVRTPMVDGEENGSLDVNFHVLEELLAQKLENYQLEQQEESEGGPEAGAQGSSLLSVGAASNTTGSSIAHEKANKIRISSTNSINEIIHSLTFASRTEVSSQSREMLLAQLYKLIVSKPLVIHNEESSGTNDYVDEEKIQALIKVFLSGDYRSSSEFSLLYRCVIALLASDIEEFSGLASGEFQTHIAKLVYDPPNQNVTLDNKSNLITGLVGLLLVLNNGSGAYGIDDRIKWLLHDVADGYVQSSITLSKQVDKGETDHNTFITDKEGDAAIIGEATSRASQEANVAISAIHGVGCLLTLMTRGDYLNEFISSDEIIGKLVEFLDNEVNVDISKAAGRVIALIYEIYTYGEDEDENDQDYNYNAPYYEQESLFQIVKRLGNLSTKKVGKKDKKNVVSIFRDILNTLENYTTKEKRIEIYKKSQQGLDLLSQSTHIKLSRTRSLSINSWFLYLRLIHLKWCFSFGVHAQLVANDTIRDILREPPSEYQLKYGKGQGTGDGDIDDDVYFTNDVHNVSEKKRTEKIRKARQLKLDDELNHLEIS
ncbi:uncharacterized protein KQ657_000445 [Scheffersomyces spartinae]|uniref:Interferon-related developmental regulator N-terminal domain-containing protein n=1 Tax=Scheffersomyces spartinae TaxID=45513 RepID=A0A9P8AIJ8_9ASCO|nr:uncharacterized protein KQ657_000445 [Scheffersomyces spartinae]KAG7193754.1 hypothetical protein KQ657_000445 [Scheffersomyces spartinae]